nr:glycerol-3-phosphate responsive antiterminator [Bacillota bacterium]
MAVTWGDWLRGTEVIPALRHDRDLEAALRSPSRVLFLLNADLRTLRPVVDRCRAAGKAVFVHYDLVAGLSADRSGVAFLAGYARPDGLISTRSAVARFSKDSGVQTVLRIFALDSAALATALEVIERTAPDAVEVLPAVLPSWVFAEIRRVHRGPVIAGGLVRNRDDVRRALAAGASAVSASSPALWS